MLQMKTSLDYVPVSKITISLLERIKCFLVQPKFQMPFSQKEQQTRAPSVHDLLICCLILENYHHGF